MTEVDRVASAPGRATVVRCGVHKGASPWQPLPSQPVKPQSEHVQAIVVIHAGDNRHREPQTRRVGETGNRVSPGRPAVIRPSHCGPTLGTFLSQLFNWSGIIEDGDQATVLELRD